MPVPPVRLGYFDKINFVIESWARPCNAPWYIYVETLWPAALEAFITFVSFGWGDVARGFARPHGLTPRRTSKRKGKWAKRIPKFPEIGNLIGSKLPGSEQVKGIRYNALGKTLWRIDGAIQGVLFWWLVADITIDFAYEWTSLLYETEWCKASSKGRFSWQDSTLRTFFGGDWRKMEINHEDYQFPEPSWFGRIGFSGPNGCTVGAGIEATAISFPPRPANNSVRILDITAGRVLSQSNTGDPEVDMTSRVPVSADIPANHQFRVEAKTDADFFQTGLAVITGMEV